MLALADIGPWYWAGFVCIILIFLALDLGVFHRHAHVVSFREAFAWTIVWVCVAMAFGTFVAPGTVSGWNRSDTVEFITGYVVELSLSMDNVFVIALIFAYFRVPLEYQHRVLFWGIIGALLMRGAMIWMGAELIHRFNWMLYVLGGFIVLTGIKMLFSADEGVHPEKNPVIRLMQRLFPVSSEFDGQRFITQWRGRRALTPLAIVLVMVETTDLIFAVDSIPAIFAVTQDAFIVFTSNVFAIMGLRSLYFVLAGAIEYFRFLKYGLSVVLVFIGAKMLLVWIDVIIPTTLSLVVVLGVIAASILFSVLAARLGPVQEEKP
ncbi:MAG: TerC family protein [Pedosphaera sp.]|nr:TerC family protein [Pedosphaera sp.]